MFSLPILSPRSWELLALAAFCVGLSKGGLPGIGILPVLFFAAVFPAKQSTGMLLLPLIVGDLTAVRVFHRHADWGQIRRVALPALLGIVAGWWSLGHLSNGELRPILGAIILVLAVIQALRARIGKWIERTYHSHGFAWTLGGLGGWTTMVANAAGPVMALFFLAMRLPKMAFVGTIAWFFCLINLCKVPFSIALGIMTWPSFTLALVCAPLIVAGVLAGGWAVHRLPQTWFERIILALAVLGGLRLFWS